MENNFSALNALTVQHCLDAVTVVRIDVMYTCQLSHLQIDRSIWSIIIFLRTSELFGTCSVIFGRFWMLS